MILYLIEYKDNTYSFTEKASFIVNTESFNADETYYLVSIKNNVSLEDNETLEEVRKLLDDNV